MARSGTNHVTSTGGRRDIVDDHPLVRDGSPGVFTGIRGFAGLPATGRSLVGVDAITRATPITRPTRPRPDNPYDTDRRRGAGEPSLVGAAYAAMVQQRRVRAEGAIWDAWTAPGRSINAAMSMPPAPADLNSLPRYEQVYRKAAAGHPRPTCAALVRIAHERCERQHRGLYGKGQPVRVGRLAVPNEL
jgi:hypothetical protein